MTAKEKNKPILVPVDFSSNSEAALVNAAELAEKMGSDLVILHIVHDLNEAPGYYSVKGRGKQMRRMEDVAAEMLNEFFQKMQKKYSNLAAMAHATTMLVVGLPVNRILESAEKINARMIVMGSQGRTGLARAMLGSKAEQVVRLASIPVMIVKEEKAASDLPVWTNQYLDTCCLHLLRWPCLRSLPLLPHRPHPARTVLLTG